MRIAGSIASFAILVALSLGVTAAPVEAAETYIKGGFIFHPSDTDLSNRWLVTFGSDFTLNLRETFFWGIELQGAFYDVGTPTQSIQIIPANGFINLKYKADKFDFRPYAGAGLGMVTAFTIADETTWDRHLGLHFQFGAELGRVAIELQMQRAFVDEAVFEYSILFGFLF